MKPICDLVGINAWSRRVVFHLYVVVLSASAARTTAILVRRELEIPQNLELVIRKQLNEVERLLLSHAVFFVRVLLEVVFLCSSDCSSERIVERRHL